MSIVPIQRMFDRRDKKLPNRQNDCLIISLLRRSLPERKQTLQCAIVADVDCQVPLSRVSRLVVWKRILRQESRDVSSFATLQPLVSGEVSRL